MASDAKKTTDSQAQGSPDLVAVQEEVVSSQQADETSRPQQEKKGHEGISRRPRKRGRGRRRAPRR
jgi:hypothetical protein